MAKPAKPSAMLFEFKPRDPVADAPEVPLATLDRKPESARALFPPVQAIDLTGKPKAWFVIGRGGVGKTTLLRWAAERADQAEARMVVAAADPLNRSLRLDRGGGDTSLHRLLQTVPDLAAVLHDGGLEAVAVHVVGANPHDLVPLAETEAAGFQPAATALVCNERLDPRDKFGPVIRHSVFRAALDRGAVPLWMPYLNRD